LKASAGNAVAQQEREGSENIQELPGNVHGVTRGALTLCIGGGQGIALLLEVVR